ADILIGFNGEWSKEVSYTGGFIIIAPGVGSVSGSIDTYWSISTEISGSSLIVTAFNIHQTDETVTLTSTAVSVRVIDYSSISLSNKIAFDSRLNYMKRGFESDGL